MHVQLIRSTDELHRLAPAWEELWQADPAADIFGSPALVITWCESFCRPSPTPTLIFHDGDRLRGLEASEARPHVLVAREGEALLAVLPLVAARVRWRGLPARALALPVNGHTMRGGLVAPGANGAGPSSPSAGAPWAAFARHLAQDPDWDLLLLEGVPSDSASLAAFLDQAGEAGIRVSADPAWTAGYTAISRTWGDYLAGRGHNFRKSMRRQARALARHGVVDLERHETPAEIEPAMAVFLEVDRESWKASGGESVALHPELSAFYRTLAGRCARQGQAEVWILRVAGEPAAAAFCLRDRRSLYVYKCSYRERFAEQLSPGFVLVNHILEDAWSRGFACVDFLGHTPAIERWATHQRELSRLTLFPGRAGASLLRFAEWLHGRMSRPGRAREPGR